MRKERKEIMKYVKPDFDVTNYEFEDVLTLSVTPDDPDGGNSSDWDDFGDF